MKKTKFNIKTFLSKHKIPIIGILSGLSIILLIIALAITQRNTVSYEDIVKNLDDSTIITADVSVSANGAFSLIFKDEVEGGSPTLSSLTAMLGIENNDLSLSGSLNYEMLTIYSEMAGYSNSEYRYMLYSNCLSLNDYLSGYLPDTSGKLEVYYDFTNGDQYTVSDNSIVKTEGTSPVSTNQDPTEIVSLISFVEELAPKDATKIKKNGDEYKVSISFELTGDFLRGLSEDTKFILNTAGYDIDAIAEVLDTTKANYGLEIPVKIEATFKKNSEKYRLLKASVNAEVKMSKDIPFSDIKQAYGLTDVDNFSAAIDFGINLGINIDLDYDPVIVNLPK